MSEQILLCECGCGQEVRIGSRFVSGHNSRCRSEETIKKIGKGVSKALKGVKNPNKARIGEKNGFYGKVHSEETKIRLSNKHKGKKLSEETKNKLREVSKGEKSYMYGVEKSLEIRQKLREANLGKKQSEETKKKRSEAQKGEKGSNWRGGLSFINYPQDWSDDLKESIRKRDNYICQECGVHQDELKGCAKKLDVHHLDYDKYNLNPINLISLCRRCHIKTNYNREYWMEYFQKNMEKERDDNE